MTAKTQTDITRLLNAVPELNSLYNTLSGVFDLIEIADSELNAAAAANPEKAQEIQSIFGQLSTTVNMFTGSINPEIFRASVRQTIERVLNKEPINRPTAAELVLALKDLSLNRPLDSTEYRDMSAAWAELGTYMPELPYQQEANVHLEWAGTLHEPSEFVRQFSRQERFTKRSTK